MRLLTGGGSKGHNSDEICNYGVNGVDRNVVLNTPVNSTEVTSFNELVDKQLHEFLDLSGVKSEDWCKNFNHNDSIHGEFCLDMYIPNSVDMYDMCSQAVHTLSNVDKKRGHTVE